MNKFQKELPLFNTENEIKLKIIDKKIADNNIIKELILQLENNVIVKHFTEVEDMIESIFEAMP